MIPSGTGTGDARDKQHGQMNNYTRLIDNNQSLMVQLLRISNW